MTVVLENEEEGGRTRGKERNQKDLRDTFMFAFAFVNGDGDGDGDAPSTCSWWGQHCMPVGHLEATCALQKDWQTP